MVCCFCLLWHEFTFFFVMRAVVVAVVRMMVMPMFMPLHMM